MPTNLDKKNRLADFVIAVIGTLFVITFIVALIISVLIGVPLFIIILGFLVYYLWTIKSGRKQIVLILRRFGNEDTVTVLSGALRRNLMHSCRFVTLDDGKFPVIGIPTYTHGLLAAATPLTLLAGLVALIIIVIVFPPAPTIGIIGMMAPILFMGFFFLAVPLIIPQIALMIIGSIAYFIYGIRTKQNGVFEINSNNDLAVAADRIEKYANILRSSVLTGPQSIILRTTDSVWRDAVSHMCYISSLIIMDITNVTDNVMWEINYCLENGRLCT